MAVARTQEPYKALERICPEALNKSSFNSNNNNTIFALLDYLARADNRRVAFRAAFFHPSDQILSTWARDEDYKARRARKPKSPNTSPSACLRQHSMFVSPLPSLDVTKRLCITHTSGPDLVAESSRNPRIAPYLVVHMCARADMECSFFHHVCLTLTPSYFARSLAVAAR